MAKASLIPILLVLAVADGVTPMPISTATISPQAASPALAVIGMSNEVKNEAWRDARVGLGLRIILSQLFFDQGSFTLLEEKAGMRARLNELGQGIWALNEVGHDFQEDIVNLKEFEPRFVVYGRVFYFGRPRSRASLGPVHLNRNSVIIKVEVTLEDLQTGKKLVGNGRGISSTTAGSAVFSYREDNIELDKTNVGNATKKALGDAVARVMKQYKRKY